MSHIEKVRRALPNTSFPERRGRTSNAETTVQLPKVASAKPFDVATYNSVTEMDGTSHRNEEDGRPDVHDLARASRPALASVGSVNLRV